MSSKPKDKDKQKQEEEEDDGFWGWFDKFMYGPPKRKTDDEPDEEPDEPTEKVIEVKDLTSVLHVKGLDLNIAENVEAHKTDKYDCTEDRGEDGKNEKAELVIRRGKTFVVHVTLDREFVPDKDDLTFSFETGKRAHLRPTTHGSCVINETERKRFEPLQWGGHLVCTDKQIATVEIQVPANCAIGKWTMFVETKSVLKGGRPATYRYRHSDPIYILFNPWCKDDLTYMEDEYLLKEYVLNDHGCVFKGNKKNPRPRVWNFGQFEDGIINVCMRMLKDSLRKSKSHHNLSNPVWVARTISKMVNCQDDRGVLVGNWSGYYDGGTSPLEWCGSVKILKQYAKTKQPVQYGQCWVFSGVTTTILRALGLPARSITNYMSAHDTDKSCTIDKFFHRDEEKTLVELEDKNEDSVWNYHVWNEVWMRRPDIATNTDGQFDGWQALDSTPQEQSDGVYQCGPCPVNAVKNGIVSLPYDTDFVFSEVNADVVHWEMTKEGPVRFKFGMNKVGHCISTKKPDGKPFDSGFLARRRSRLDVTNYYKFKDGSEQGRRAVMRAALGADNSRGAYQQAIEKEDIKFKLIHEGELILGDNLEVTLLAKNISSSNRTVSVVTFRFLKQKYTGRTEGQPFHKDKQEKDVQVKAKDSYEFKTTLKREDYIDHIDEDGSLCIQVYALVKPGGGRPLQNCVKSHTVQVEETPLEIKVPGKVKKGVKFDAIIKVDNPLDCELTQCYAEYEGRGFQEKPKVKLSNVPARSSSESKLEMMPIRSGKFVVTFHCQSDQLHQLSGSTTIVVK